MVLCLDSMPHGMLYVQSYTNMVLYQVLNKKLQNKDICKYLANGTKYTNMNTRYNGWH